MSAVILRTSAVVLALVGIGLVPIEQAAAASVCYKMKEYPEGRLVLDVKKHSNLATTKWGGKQEVWEADGKHINSKPPKQMAVFDGSVVTSSGTAKRYGAYGQVPGAHLGGTSYFVRGPAGLGPKVGQASPMFWECTSKQASATPNSWGCSVSSGSNPVIGVTLEKLRHPDMACDIFEDTVAHQPKPPKDPKPPKGPKK
jgi:hypothetical protein